MCLSHLSDFSLIKAEMLTLMQLLKKGWETAAESATPPPRVKSNSSSPGQVHTNGFYEEKWL